jgi:predicted deacylase
MTMKTLPNYVEIIRGTRPGPKVMVMGAVHGNERLGAEVITMLRREITPESLSGTLTLVLGNPAAYAIDRRFVDNDLNRLFGPDHGQLAQKDPAMLTTEEKRALELAPLLQGADYLLDIHCTIKPSVPFVYCEATPRHVALARLFESQYIVSPAAEGHVIDLHASSDNFVDAHGGVGLTYEAGWHKQPSALADVVAKTYNFLRVVGSLEGTPANPSSEPIHLEIYETIIPQDADFKFEKDFSNFDAYDQNSLIIFPKLDIISDKPAGYLGRLKPPNPSSHV